MASISKRRRGGQRRRLPQTLAQFDALPKRSQTTMENVAHAVTRVREGESLKSSAAEFGIDPRTVVKLSGSTLRKNASGRYTARASDTLLRVMVVPMHGGRVEVAVRGSRAASVLAKRAAAQGEFLATGDDAKLRQLRRTKIFDAAGNEVPFLTDPDDLFSEKAPRQPARIAAISSAKRFQMGRPNPSLWSEWFAGRLL
jgi:hypothetical protein